MTLIELSATEARRKIDGGEISCEELVRACLDRIDQIEGEIGAWTHLDPDYALDQARARDSERQRGVTQGPLHGIPVGIKDIIDTSDFPTECGTPLHGGRTPSEDATLVAVLREAGAVILGKTVTTELAVYSPGKTTNPADTAHTPGGSSSGSAAAVASAMVPLSIGTQTNGSVIRPASFCGVLGFKPSHGRISRAGVLKQSPPLDTVGVFARSLDDVALISEVLMAFDARDPDMRPRSRPRLSATLAEAPPVEPRLAFVRTPVWDQAEDSTKDAMRELIEHLGESVDIVDLPAQFEDAHEAHRRIMNADLARSFAAEYTDGEGVMSEVLREMIENGQQVLATEYNSAVARIAEFNGYLDPICEHYDAILTPSAPGEAPMGLEKTGNPTFCTIWTLCGTPALSLPLLLGPKGLPLGVQVISQKNDDARLLRTARWIMESLEN
ncbi:MAG: amidase [Rhodospirillales bacterium]|jgi:Asp-tRNA(Asn)/Glu-tRNA(Gln) amidotransferase A subunit family amidase|nr:amidase [Rhodospirillales bacterium]MDP6883472.1 amidase [Rhodospirillales bacterium]